MAAKKERIVYSQEIQKFVVDNRRLGFTYPEILDMMKKKIPEDGRRGVDLPAIRGIGYRALGLTGHPRGRNAEKAVKTKLERASSEVSKETSDQVIANRVQTLKDQGYSPSHIAKFLKDKFGVLKTASEINRMAPKGSQIKHPEIGLEWGKDLEFIELKLKVPVKHAAKAILALFGGYI